MILKVVQTTLKKASGNSGNTERQQATLVFAKAGRTEAVFQLFVFQFGFISGRRTTI